MNKFTKLIRDLLQSKINDIDCGNSNVDEESAIAILKAVSDSTDMTKRVSKYKACQILCISRATFDNYVREGKLPKGEHTIGFKELSWDLKTLNDFKTKYWNK
jgi:predicted DNA-binding transcriptional regulator AlpA